MTTTNFCRIKVRRYLGDAGTLVSVHGQGLFEGATIIEIGSHLEW